MISKLLILEESIKYFNSSFLNQTVFLFLARKKLPTPNIGRLSLFNISLLLVADSLSCLYTPLQSTLAGRTGIDPLQSLKASAGLLNYVFVSLENLPDRSPFRIAASALFLRYPSISFSDTESSHTRHKNSLRFSKASKITSRPASVSMVS